MILAAFAALANYWNKLPEVIKILGVNEKSINGLRSGLKKFKTDNFNKPKDYWELSSESDVVAPGE